MHIVLVYIGIFLGVFLEGDIIMLSSIIASRSGNLNLWYVISLGIIGTIFSDMLYFIIGRKRGKLWLIKHKKYISKAKKVNAKIEKYPILIFIGYRFLYGLRTVAPLLIGISKTKSSKFIFYCFFSTILWAAVYSIPGYYFGELLKTKLIAVEQVERYIFLIIALLGIVLFIKKKLSKNKMPI